MSGLRSTGDWRTQLALVDDLMRRVSMETDPQRLVLMYGDTVGRLYPSDLYLALSRRDLAPPYYRITRNSRWEDDIDPWAQRGRLPVFSGGILGEWAFADRPIVLQDFEVDSTDQHCELLAGMRSVLVIPHYDRGQGINVSVIAWEKPGSIDESDVAAQHWRMNLFGRATHNLVLRKELAAALAALDRELQVVGDIQRSLLPSELPRIPTLDLAAHYRTSQRAGGDYYDIFPLAEDRWGLFIADVSGHGTPAAVMMAVTHAIAHGHPGPPDPPEALLARLNDTLHNGYTRGNGTFVTAFYAVYDAGTRVLRYASAGHNPPRHRSRDHVSPLDGAQSLPLGVIPSLAFAAAETRLLPGDGLLLYTDGISEAMNPRNELFGVDRLDAAIAESPTADAMIAAVTAAVSRHAEDRPPADDQTLLAAVAR